MGYSKRARKRGGVITRAITDVNGVAAKMKATRVVAIGWDALAVVSARGMVDGRGLITSGARSRAWPRNDEGGWRIRDNTSRKRRRRMEEWWQQMQDAKKVEQLPTSHCLRS